MKYKYLLQTSAVVLGASALSKFVLATDCSDARLEDLTETYMSKADAKIPAGLRWFYCVGFGTALACMSRSICYKNINSKSTKLFSGAISVCHIHKDTKGFRIRIRKRYRVANRLVVCIIMCCLPTVHSLDSLQLVSVMTGLVVWVLLLELWGMSCPDESLFGEKTTCRYTARCKISKKDLEAAMKGGAVVNVRSLSDRGEKGMYELS